jgi:hypothetical protein
MSEVTRINPQEHTGAYPLNQVISIMPTEKDAITAFDSLIANGFLESEVSRNSPTGSELPVAAQGWSAGSSRSWTVWGLVAMR